MFNCLILSLLNLRNTGQPERIDGRRRTVLYGEKPSVEIHGVKQFAKAGVYLGEAIPSDDSLELYPGQKAMPKNCTDNILISRH